MVTGAIIRPHTVPSYDLQWPALGHLARYCMVTGTQGPGPEQLTTTVISTVLSRSPNPSLPPSSALDHPSNMSAKLSSVSEKSAACIEKSTSHLPKSRKQEIHDLVLVSIPPPRSAVGMGAPLLVPLSTAVEQMCMQEAFLHWDRLPLWAKDKPLGGLRAIHLVVALPFPPYSAIGPSFCLILACTIKATILSTL